MKAYLGKTRSRSLVARLEQLQLGECVVRGDLAPLRTSSGWFYDNGAFVDFTQRRAFDARRFVRDQWAIANGGIGTRSGVVRFPAPDFIVLPDLVGGGPKSLTLSMEWENDMGMHWAAPRYLAVQDGMTQELVAAALDREGQGVAGIFVGGTLPWKLLTGDAWVRFAHDRGLLCHVGRVGTPERVAWARAIDVDSIDSCLPLWTTGKLDAFVEALS